MSSLGRTKSSSSVSRTPEKRRSSADSPKTSSYRRIRTSQPSVKTREKQLINVATCGETCLHVRCRFQAQNRGDRRSANYAAFMVGRWVGLATPTWFWIVVLVVGCRDTAGQERFHTITRLHFRGALVSCLCCCCGAVVVSWDVERDRGGWMDR